jgi:hypothetical protein
MTNYKDHFLVNIKVPSARMQCAHPTPEGQMVVQLDWSNHAPAAVHLLCSGNNHNGLDCRTVTLLHTLFDHGKCYAVISIRRFPICQPQLIFFNSQQL